MKVVELEKRIRELEKLIARQDEEIKLLKETIRKAKDISPVKRPSRKRVEREAQSRGFGLKK